MRSEYSLCYSDERKDCRWSQVPSRAPVLLRDLTGRLGEPLQTGDHSPLHLGWDRLQQLSDLDSAPFGDEVHQETPGFGQTDSYLTPVVTVRPTADGVTATASARAATPWGPRAANTTKDLYWVSVTSSPTSANERAAIATKTRLAVTTASRIESWSGPFVFIY
jgi:hypothetical protein